MASDVTVTVPAFAPIKLPQRCCYCLAPATTTAPLRVFASGVRVSRTRKTSLKYDLPVPYCERHGAQARRLRRSDRAVAVALFVAMAALLAGFDLAAGRALRELGGLVWLAATVLVMITLALAAVLLYTGGRLLLSRRDPAVAAQRRGGTLGAQATCQAAHRPAAEGEPALLVLRLTFHNDEFAAQTAALHGVAASPAAGA